jgi:hypothetical protein
MALAHWDPDGAGPAAPLVVAAGAFPGAGMIVSNGIAAWDRATGAWLPLGTGMDGAVRCLAVLPTGELVAGGDFTIAGGAAANHVARWNGVAWSPLGAGLNGPVYALAVRPAGDLVAGGAFTSVAGGADRTLARWDGQTWSGIGGTDGTVLALAALPNGDVVAAGSFLTAGGTQARNVARWNGATWSALGVGVLNAVNALAVLPNGNVVTGGGVYPFAPFLFLSQWDGVSWSPLLGDADTNVRAFAIAPNGDLIAGGDFITVAGQPAVHVARWNGTSWSALGSGFEGAVCALLVLPDGEVVAGGAASSGHPRVGGMFTARWNGAGWYPLGFGVNDVIEASATLPNGDLLVAGNFSSIGGIAANGIARRDSAGWHAVGSGFTGVGAGFTVVPRGLLVEPDGAIVAGGSFPNPGGFAARVVARWDGTTWSTVGSGLIQVFQLASIVRLGNGDLVVGGLFFFGSSAARMARWDGVNWQPFGNVQSGVVQQLLLLPNGTLLAAGQLGLVGGVNTFLAQWNGQAWVPFAGDTDGRVNAMLVCSNGDLAISGSFTTAGGVRAEQFARWNGQSWAPLGGNGTTDSWASALVELADGDLLAGGGFTIVDGVPAARVARWNGSAWTPIDGGTSGPVRTMTMTRAGELFAGGDFFVAGGNASVFQATLTTSCVAGAVEYGSGCSGSAGPVALHTDTLPWIGGVYRATATGFAAGAWAFSFVGTTALAVPLSSLHPAGLPGCTQLASLDVLTEVLAPASGSVAVRVAVPDDQALVGLVFLHQVAAVELDAAMAIVGLATSNALRLTIGAF